jgi:hypothetical protein
MEGKVTLPRAYSVITPVSFFPDKVTLNFQFVNYFTTPLLTRCFYRNGLRSRGPLAWSGRIALSTTSNRRPLFHALRVTRPNFRAPLNFYLDLNVLREVHAHTRTANEEAPTVAAETNFIPAHLVQRDNRWTWELMDVLRQRGLERLSDIMNYIHAEQPSVPTPYCSHISVSSIEAAVDFGAVNPRHMVTTYSSAFGALLRNVEHLEYARAAIRVVRPEANWMVHGFIARGDRIKMYAKTNLRVRWEYRFEKSAFDRLNISRSLADDDRTFATVFSRCAEQASTTFSALNVRTKPVFNINQPHTPMDLLSNFAACTRDPATLRELFDCLVYSDKVDHSRFNRAFIERLRTRGLLQPSLARGFSCVPPVYIRALNSLRRTQYNFFSTKLLQSVAEHKVLPRPAMRSVTTRRST